MPSGGDPVAVGAELVAMAACDAQRVGHTHAGLRLPPRRRKTVRWRGFARELRAAPKGLSRTERPRLSRIGRAESARNRDGGGGDVGSADRGNAAPAGAGRAHVASRLDANQSSENRVRSNPAVDATAVLPDLEPLALNGFDEVKVFGAVHFAQNDIAHGHLADIDGRNVQNWSAHERAAPSGPPPLPTAREAPSCTHSISSKRACFPREPPGDAEAAEVLRNVPSTSVTVPAP